MRVVKPQSLLISCAPLQIGSAAALGLSVGLGFRLSDPRIFKHEAQVWQAVSQTPSCLPLHEMARPKHFAEWLLAGHTQCEFGNADDQQLRDWTAELRLAKTRKAVSAKALVQANSGGRFVARLLVDHSQATRGARGRNPLGQPGPDAPLQQWGLFGAREQALAGMGPIDSRWPDCMQWAPVFEDTVAAMARNGSRLGWPAGTDRRFFQQACADQWADEPHWPAAAGFVLRGFGRLGGEISGQLPGVHAALAIQRKGSQQAESVSLAQQTVWFLPDHDIGVMWWHGSAPLPHVLDDSIGLVVAAAQGLDVACEPTRLLDVATRRTQLTGIDYASQCDAQLMPAVHAGWTWEQVRDGSEVTPDASPPKSYDRLRQEVAEAMDDLVQRHHQQTQVASTLALPVPASPPPEVAGSALTVDWRARLQNAATKVLRQVTLSHQDLSGLVLHHWTWEDVRLEHCTLDQAWLEHCQFSNVTLVGCRLHNLRCHHLKWSDGSLRQCATHASLWQDCTLERLHWDGCTVFETRFEHSQWSEVLVSAGAWSRTQWEHSSLRNLILQDLKAARDMRWNHVQAEGLSLLRCELPAMHLERCRIGKLSALECHLDHSRWLSCRLRSANLTHGSTLNHAAWRDCELIEACWIDLPAAHLDIEHCTFRKFTAQGLKAEASRWTSTVLAEANLLNASLRGALLERSALRGAVLVGAELRNSQVRHCNLVQADLSESTLPQPGAWHSNLEGGCITAPRRFP